MRVYLLAALLLLSACHKGPETAPPANNSPVKPAAAPSTEAT